MLVSGLISKVINKDLRICPASHVATLTEGPIRRMVSTSHSVTERIMNSLAWVEPLAFLVALESDLGAGFQDRTESGHRCGSQQTPTKARRVAANSDELRQADFTRLLAEFVVSRGLLKYHLRRFEMFTSFRL